MRLHTQREYAHHPGADRDPGTVRRTHNGTDSNPGPDSRADDGAHGNPRTNCGAYG